MTDRRTNELPSQALILKGGGVKGLAFAGALQVLEKYFSFNLFIGTSAGAIAAALLAVGYSGEQLSKILSEKDFRDFVSEPWYSCVPRLLMKGGLFSGDGIRQWVKDLVKSKIDKRTNVLMRDLPKRAILFASKKPEGIVVFDSDGDHDDTPVDLAVRYSMSIPFFFRPLRVDEERVYDGGMLRNFPLDEFLNRFPESTYLALYLSGPKPATSRRVSMVSEVIQLLLGRDELTLVDQNSDRIVVIDPSPVRTTQFSLTQVEKNFLLAEGQAAAWIFLRDKLKIVDATKEAARAKDKADKLREEVVSAFTARRSRFHRHISLALGVIAMMFAVMVFCIWYLNRPGDEIPNVFPVRTMNTPTPTPADPLPPEEAQALAPLGIDVDKMNEKELRSYVGQLFLVGFESDKGMAALIEQYGIGGVVLYNHNAPLAKDPIEKRAKFISFTDELRLVAERKQPLLPLIVATDQEGGSTGALPASIVSEVPAAMALGGLRKPDAVEQAARLIGQELRLLGVNVDLAPVVDINTNMENDMIRERSFGSNADLVSTLSSAWLRGANATGVLSVAKHFPGHGSTEEGIEVAVGEVPRSSVSYDGFLRALRPFRSVIEAGVPAIMTSHMRLESVPELQGNVTFSRSLFTLLRKPDSSLRDAAGFNFDGLVITDDLGLPSVTMGTEQTYISALRSNVERAFEAGHDLLMIAHIGSQCCPRTKNEQIRGVSIAQFGELLQDFEGWIFDDHVDEDQHRFRVSRFREALSRVVKFKTKIPPPIEGTISVRAEQLEKLRAENAAISDGLFRASFASIAPRTGCPSFQLGAADRILVVFPVGWSAGALERNKLNRQAYADAVKKQRDGWLLLREFDEVFSARTKVDIELEEALPQEAGYTRRARELAGLVSRNRPKLVIFFIANTYHAKQLAFILNEFNRNDLELDRAVIVVLGRPNVLNSLTQERIAKDLVAKVTYLFPYTGWGESIERADKLFVRTLAELPPGKCVGENNRPPVFIARLIDDP